MLLCRMNVAVLLALGGVDAQDQSASSATGSSKKLDTRFLPNAFRITDKVISGGLPEGESGFRELATLGVKTIVSVDGLKPDVVAAKKYGLRYVHLPHGYDGVPEMRGLELAKAVRDLPGPIYIHCHHGKHRSPAAAAVACVSAGVLDPARVELVLKSAGTSPEYRGLYASARSARAIDAKALDSLQVEFPETAKLPPLAEAMVALEQTHDHLKAIAAAGWKSPPTHPDLLPSHEALLLREHFTEMLRLESVAKEPAAYRDLFKNAETAAKDLEEALKSGLASGSSLAKAKSSLASVTRTCTACHRQFRDIPLNEKRAPKKRGDPTIMGHSTVSVSSKPRE